MQTDKTENYSSKVSVSEHRSFNEDERITKKCDETSHFKGINSPKYGGDLCFDIFAIKIFGGKLIKNTPNVST
jgi:hypothetical protein